MGISFYQFLINLTFYLFFLVFFLSLAFRLSYAVWILPELEKEAAEKPDLKMNVLYDIACTLTKYLQVTVSFVLHN